MSTKYKTPPVIITGMHRSGTTMISNLLEQSGLFLGQKKEGNNEATFFIFINNWLMRQTGATWFNPQNFESIYSSDADKSTYEISIDYINWLLNCPKNISYLGFKNFLKYKGKIRNISSSWGWKDPRCSYTLPFWLSLFPDAKVVHIKRHGVDVANSLVVRSKEILQQNILKHERRKFFPYLVADKTSGFVDSIQNLDHHKSMSLWWEYNRNFEILKQKFDFELYELRYEDFLLGDATKIYSDLIEFCDLKQESQKVGMKVLGKLNSNRAYAFKKNLVLSKIEQDNLKLLADFDY